MPTKTTQEEPNATVQADFEGRPRPEPDVDHEVKHTLTHRFEADRFVLKITDEALAKLKRKTDVREKYRKLAAKVRPHPDVAEIPPGARKRETEELVAAALDTPTRA